MPIERDITNIRLTKDDSCFVCDLPIAAGLHVTQVETTVVFKLRRRSHPECAIRLGHFFIKLGTAAAALNGDQP